MSKSKSTRDTLVDCLFIGHNEMNFSDYEKSIRKMGTHSGTYRDLKLNYIRYDNRPYTAPEIFNLFYCSDNTSKELRKPLQVTEILSPAIAYLGTYLERRGFTFDYVNAFQLEKEELKQKLSEGNILTVAIITTLYVSVLPVLEIMEFIRAYNRDARIVIGGPFISTQARTLAPAALEYMFNSVGADFYVNSSQGEGALVEIIRALKNNLPFDRIHNIYYKTGSSYRGTSVVTEENKLSENMVNWDLFADRVGESLNIRTAISCPFSCSFCGFPQHAGKYQTVSVEKIEEELNAIEKISRVKSLHIIDDTFNVPRERFEEILKMMIKNKYSFKWYSHYRCQFADKEIVELMKESGCEGVFLGIESGNDGVLQNMRKAATVEKYYNGVSLLKEIGILTYASFIIGFPGETEDTVGDTVRFIKESDIDFYRAQLWYCAPLTPIWKEREKYNLKGESFEWSHSTMNSQKASDLIEEIFCSIDEPIWVPQYNFECAGLFHMFHRGFSTEKVNAFLKAFNTGVREELKNPSLKEVGIEVIRQIRNNCRETPATDAPPVPGKNISDTFEADFGF